MLYFSVRRNNTELHWKLPCKNTLSKEFLSHMKRPQSPIITIYKDSEAKYQHGTNSILQNLPTPTPSIKTLFSSTNKAIFLHAYWQIRFSIVFLLLVMTAISIMQDLMKRGLSVRKSCVHSHMMIMIIVISSKMLIEMLR